MTIIDVVPVYVRAVGGDEHDAPGNPKVNSVQLDYSVVQRLGRKSRLSVYLRRQNLDSTLGSTYVAPARKVNFGGSYAKVDRIGVEYYASRSLQIQAGHWYKWIACCPGAGDPANHAPQYYGGPYLGVQYAWGPRTVLGRVFQATYEGIDVQHSMNAFSQKRLSPTLRNQVEGTKFLNRMSLSASAPVGRGRSMFVPFAYAAQIVDYYNNFLPFPGYATLTIYGVRKPLSKTFAVQADLSNVLAHRDGFLPVPNVAHHAEFNIRGIIHLTAMR